MQLEAASIIARNLGMGFMLDVATEVTAFDDGLEIQTRSCSVNIRMLGVDKFLFQGQRVAYAFELRGLVEELIGPYDRIGAEIRELFRAAQESARLEASWHYCFMREIHRHRGRREFTQAERRAAEGHPCLCGCGRPLPYTSNPSRRRFATPACIRAAYAVKRSAKSEAARETLERKLCACGCGREIPRTGRWWRKKWIDRSHMMKAHYDAHRSEYHDRYVRSRDKKREARRKSSG